jgi:TrmH family RNA methyltransferase
MKYLSSLQNPHVKRVLQLKEKGRLRKETGLFVIEGVQEIELACQAGYSFAQLFYAPDKLGPGRKDWLASLPSKELLEVSDKVYQKLAYREGTEGLLAVAYAQKHGLEDLKLGPNPLVLVAEAPEKPGNIGALMRTARAVGVDAICIANPRSDLYHPNIIRSSVGCLFGLPIALASSTETLSYLRGQGIKIFSSTLEGSVSYLDVSYTTASAIVVGTESTGLNSEWLEAAEECIRIPMRSKMDSLNVSVATGILLYEALRQRTIA